MSSPTIPDLPSASVVNDTDQLLIRQPAGSLGTDKKATAALLRQFNVAGFPMLPTSPVIDDLMSLSRNGVNYQIRFDQVSFIAGTQMWFYSNSAPSGWSPIAGGDCLLAVKGSTGGVTDYMTGGNMTNPGNVVIKGTWQQFDHVLDVTQIPPHSHTYTFADSSSIGTKLSRPPRQFEAANINSGITNLAGGGQGHNHGLAWRPAAAVGILAVKS